MSQPSLTERVDALHVLLREIEDRVGRGESPGADLAEFKSAVDELRLRLWALLGAGSANDYRGFQDQFRLRRARDVCLGVERDLRQGAISPRHEELRSLGAAAAGLARAVAEADGGR